MQNTTFLQKIARQLIEDYQSNLSDIIIVLPNKRAKVFLMSILQQEVANVFIAPKIVSIEDFIQQISGIQPLEPLDLLFEFHKTYSKITTVANRQSFDQFSNWAKTLIQDFNEIDRYLLEPNKVFSYLKDIEDIKHWSVDASQQTDMIQNYLEFWNMLPVYYQQFSDDLLQQKVGYQGMIYRLAVNQIDEFCSTLSQTYIFAGFNALNRAEEILFQKMMLANKAKVYWDIDGLFLHDHYHDAGYFARKIKNSWAVYQNHPFEWIVDAFSQEKEIAIIGTPKSVGQAKIVGDIVQKVQSENANLQQVAVVLGDENFLLPVIYALPDNVSKMNITMSYQGKSNPAQILIAKYFKMHQNAQKRDEKNYVFYYKEVLELLEHPFIAPYIGEDDTIRIIKSNNITFLSLQYLLKLLRQNDFTQLLFQNVAIDNPIIAIDNAIKLLELIKNKLSSDDNDAVSRSFIFAVYQSLVKLHNYVRTEAVLDNLATLATIYKQMTDLIAVSFEGEPLEGLQLMGVLESRVLDFDTVIITSMNEGTFPAGKAGNSFIPYDVKRELGLPTFKEKDAIYSYHFYHLLLRAKNIYLLYNTESEGLDAGEKSRFLTQLEIEKQPKHTLTTTFYQAFLPEVAAVPMQVAKSELVMQRLQEIATTTGFSPSSLTSYIRNPMQFYWQKIVRIYEADEVEENIALNTLGTIIHGTLEALYLPFLNEILSANHIDLMLHKVNNEVSKQFKEIYKEGSIQSGKNLLAFEVAKRNIYNFLQQEKENLATDELIVLALEHTLETTIEVPFLSFPIKLKGNIDRIEKRNGVIRIIDYKTGKVEPANLQIKNWDNFTNDIKNDKKIQLLCYALFYQKYLSDNEQLEVGIISFKNKNMGFMPLTIVAGKEKNTFIESQVLEDFKQALQDLFRIIFDKNSPFVEVEN